MLCGLEFGKFEVGLSLIWVFGIEFDMLEFSIEFGIEFEMEFGIEFDMLEFSIKFGTEFSIEFDIEFDKLEIGIECGKLSNFVHNGFPYYALNNVHYHANASCPNF